MVLSGLLPKVLVMHEDEVKMFSNIGLSAALAQTVVFIVGIAEITFAFFWLLPLRKRYLFALQVCIFPILTLGAVFADFQSLSAPFNPVTFNAALWVVSIIGLVISKDLPTAKSCKRKRGDTT